MNRWERGRGEIDLLLRQGRLTRVSANRQLANNYIADARKHIESAVAIKGMDPSGAFNLAYDSARMSLAAVLLVQGLRPSGEGAHAVLLEALLAQLEPPKQVELREFGWMRRLRNDNEYPALDTPRAAEDDIEEAIPAVRQIIERAATLVDVMPPY